MKHFFTFIILMTLMKFGYAQRPMPKVFNQQQPIDSTIPPDLLPSLFNTTECSPNMNAVNRYLLSMPYVIDKGDAKLDRLVSDASFRALIKNDFTKTVMGMDNVSKLDRYASLDLSSKPAFDFSPIAWNDNIKNHVFRNIFSVDISGKLNSSDILEFSSLRDLTLKLNYAFIFNMTNYKPKEAIAKLKSQLYCDTKSSINDLTKKYAEKFDDLCNGNCVTAKELVAKRKELVSSFMSDFVDIETKAAEPYWKSKHYYWLSANVGIKRDKFQWTNKTALSQNQYNANTETIFTPEATVALNAFHLYASGASILYSISASVKQRHSLSEVYTPDDFQPFFKVNDSLIQLKDKESVFVTDFTKIDKKFKGDIGARLIVLSPNITKDRKQQVGISFSFSRKALVYSDKAAALNRSDLGLVFPFLKNDGSSKFNLELFHRWDNYSHFPNEDDKTWGFRFNVPISK